MLIFTAVVVLLAIGYIISLYFCSVIKGMEFDSEKQKANFRILFFVSLIPFGGILIGIWIFSTLMLLGISWMFKFFKDINEELKPKSK